MFKLDCGSESNSAACRPPCDACSSSRGPLQAPQPVARVRSGRGQCTQRHGEVWSDLPVSQPRSQQFSKSTASRGLCSRRQLLVTEAATAHRALRGASVSPVETSRAAWRSRPGVGQAPWPSRASLQHLGFRLEPQQNRDRLCWLQSSGVACEERRPHRFQNAKCLLYFIIIVFASGYIAMVAGFFLKLSIKY